MIKTLLIACLATFILFQIQFDVLDNEYLLTDQFKRHQDVLNGRAGNPWQYRVLPELIIEPFLYVFGTINGFKVAFGVMVMAVWIALLFYYRALGISDNASLLGISILACTFAYSTWDASLSWSILLEIVFFALMGRMAMVLSRKHTMKGLKAESDETTLIQGNSLLTSREADKSGLNSRYAILPLIILATLNRETAVFMAAMLFLTNWQDHNVRKMFVIAFLCFLAIYGGLRLWFPPQHQIIWYHGIAPFTWQHLHLNATSLFGWVRLWWFLGAIPIIVYANIKRISNPLKRWLIWIVPAWCVLNFCGAFIGEPNKYWTMQAIFLLPAVLKIMQRSER